MTAVAAGVIIILFLLPVWGFACGVYEEKLIDSQKERFHHDFSSYSNSFTYILNQRIGLIEALYSFVITGADKNRLDDEFVFFSSALQSGSPEIKAIGVAPGGVFSYVYPVFGNEMIIDYDLLNDTRPAIVRQNDYLLNGKPFVLRGPLKLIQGSEGIVISKAVFLNGTYLNGDLWGFVSIWIDMPEVYRQSGISDIHGFRVAIKNDDYGVFYGNQSVFESDPGLYDMKIGNEVWTFGIAPENGWASFVQPQLLLFQRITFIFVIIAGFLGGYTVYNYLWLNLAVLKRTKELEKAQENLLFRDLAIESSVSPVVISNKTGKIVYMNKAALKLWNIDENTAKTKDMASLVREPELISGFLNSDNRKESLVGELGGIKDDGTFFFAYASISAIKDKTGNFHGIHGSFIDITAEKESRIRETEAIKQIEKNLLRLAALNDEIRNPLAVIVGYASMNDFENSDIILEQAGIIDSLIKRLDQSWLESEKIREYLWKYHGISKEKDADNDENA